VLHEPRFCDLPAAQLWARLLDDGVSLASLSTMDRLLREQGERRDRRRQRPHPARVQPQLVATRPNDLWSWAITKLPGPDRGSFFDRYVLLDLYSRYAPGWLVAPGESAELAEGSSPTPSPASGRPGRRACRPWLLDDLQAGRATVR
jgi:putative transposase